MSNIITLNGNLEVEDWVANRDEVLAEGNTIQVISNDADLDRLSKIVARAKKLVKKLSEKRKEVTAPADEFKKQVMAVEKNETELLNKLIAHGDKLMGDYALAKARQAEEERRAIEAQQAALAEAEVERQRRAELAASTFGVNQLTIPAAWPMPELHPKITRAKASNASFRETWTYEIINPNLVPRELCSPDPEKIKALLKSKKAEGYKTDEIVVQGLRISTTMQVRSR
jgi:hypothetical protein